MLCLFLAALGVFVDFLSLGGTVGNIEIFPFTWQNNHSSIQVHPTLLYKAFTHAERRTIYRLIFWLFLGSSWVTNTNLDCGFRTRQEPPNHC